MLKLRPHQPRYQSSPRSWKRVAFLGMTALILFIASPVAQAATAEPLPNFKTPDEARKFFNFDGEALPQSQYYTEPSQITDQTKPSEAKVVICKTAGDCNPDSGAAKYTFTATEARRQDRQQGGKDVYDFVFSPGGGTNLKFWYRTYADGSARSSSALVTGNPGDGFSLSANRVGPLDQFADEPLARDFLDKQANPDGIKAFEAAGVTTAKTEKSFFDQNKEDDPFAKAVAKMAEVLTSFLGSLIAAITWAMDIGDLQNIEGLVAGWKVVRDLVNIVFVLVLLAIAIMTIMRIESQKYSIRALLPMLIFAVIGVNFSLLIATVLVNSAYVLSQPFLVQSRALIESAGTVVTQGGGDFGQAVVILLATLIMVVALVVLLFFIIARIIIVWLFTVLSPVIFIAAVLPLSRGQAKRLLSTLINWTYLAPIAFLIMYLGASVGFANTVDQVGDPGAEAILRAVFYAGVLLAAVAIPLQLGGSIAKMLSNQGGRFGKMGGKGGLGLAGAIPLIGTGMSLGEATRTGRGFLKQRSDQQESRAAERAAGIGSELHERLGGGSVAAAVTGRDITQAQSVTESLVDKQVKELQARGFQVNEALGITAFVKERNPAQRQQLFRQLSPEQRGLAESYIGRRAAAKITAEQGWWDASDLRQFGDTGYQSLISGDLLMQNVRRQRYTPNHQFTGADIDQASLSIALAGLDGEGMRKLYTPTWDYLDPTSLNSQQMGGAAAVYRQAFSDAGLQGRHANFNALRQNINKRHRNAMMDDKHDRVAATFSHLGNRARVAVLSGSLDSREDRFRPLAGGPQTYAQAQAMAPPDYVQE